MPVAVAQPVERLPETQGAAGSTPAGHIARRTRPTRPASRKDCHRRGTPSRKRVAHTGLGVRLPLLPSRLRSSTGRAPGS